MQVIVVEPLVLDVMPQTRARPPGGARARLVDEQHMGRRVPALGGQFAQALQQQGLGLGVDRRPSRPGAGREGHGVDQPWVVRLTQLLRRTRPGEIKDEFTVGMSFQVQRAGGQQPAIGGFQQQMARPPAQLR